MRSMPVGMAHSHRQRGVKNAMLTLLVCAAAFVALASMRRATDSGAAFLGGGRGLVARPAAGASESFQDVPKVYVYDHCPFCVRARMIFGFKDIPHELVFMGNHDVDTPTRLVGKKIAPILEVPGESPMGESLDIIKRIDEDPKWGAPVLRPASGREDLSEWTKRVSGVMRLLVRPRYPKGFFAEFAREKSRQAFVRNHPIADPDTGVVPSKAEWLEMDSRKWHSWYDAHLASTDKLLEELNAAMPELETMIHSEEAVTEGGISYDDVIFFDRLRGATMVKGVKFGPRTSAYLEAMSKRCDVPLLYQIAI